MMIMCRYDLQVNICRYSEIKDYTFGQEPTGGPTTGLFSEKKIINNADDSKLKTFESDEKYLYKENAVGLLVFPAGHFTQIVWRESTHLGVGLAQKDGKVSSLSIKIHQDFHFLK